MLVCERCLYSINHPFGLEFKNGICSGCITHDEKDKIDWQDRKQKFIDMLRAYKKSHRSYDCVVPVVGDAEDYHVLSLTLELGLSPLVVCVNDYFKNDIGWYNLHNLFTHFDVDSVVYNPNMSVYKELVRTSLRKFDHLLLPFLQLHTSFPVHVAIDRKIPLIIWGQNQSVEQVGKFSHLDNVEMSRWSRRQHDLFNVECSKLIGNGAQVDERNLNFYNYPNLDHISKSKVRGVYLSNYFRWDPLIQNHQTLRFGFQPEKHSSTFDPYERAGNSVYYNLHDLLKFKRVGYQKIDDHVARELRHKRLTISNAKELKKMYRLNFSSLDPFFDWLGVTSSGRKWYLKHRLGSLNFSTSDTEISGGNIPKKLLPLISKSLRAKKRFVTLGKGV